MSGGRGVVWAADGDGETLKRAIQKLDDAERKALCRQLCWAADSMRNTLRLLDALEGLVEDDLPHAMERKS